MGAFIELLIRVSNINEVVSSYPEPFEVSFIEDLQKHLNLKILNTKKGYWTELPVWSEEKQIRVLQKQYFENYEISFEKDMKRKVLIGVSQDTGYFHVSTCTHLVYIILIQGFISENVENQLLEFVFHPKANC